MSTQDTIQFFDYDKVLQDIEAKIATCDDLATLLELYSRQSAVLKLMLEQCELDGKQILKKTRVK